MPYSAALLAAFLFVGEWVAAGGTCAALVSTYYYVPTQKLLPGALKRILGQTGYWLLVMVFIFANTCVPCGHQALDEFGSTPYRSLPPHR